jgi:hypothetical protein
MSLVVLRPLIRRFATFSHEGRREGRCNLLTGYAASMRLNPFHIAVAAPEVSTGRILVS